MFKGTHFYKLFRAHKKLKKRVLFPNIVMIQTVTMCNADCVCCPYPYLKNDGKLKQGIMSDTLFAKIVAELKNSGVKRISPYLNNEPFIDKNLPYRIEQLAAQIRDAELHLSTNASLLNEDKAEIVANSLTKLHISTQGGITNKENYLKNMPGIQYEDTKNNIEVFLDFIKHGNFRLKPSNVTINNVIGFESQDDFEKEMDFWKKYGVKTNIGGFNSYSGIVEGFDRKKKISDKVYGCADKDRPLQAMQILFDGICAMCCNDWVREISLGDVNGSSIKEIWNSQFYRKQAEMIYSGEEIKNHMCNRCDLAIK